MKELNFRVAASLCHATGDRGGFTLIELVITVTIMTILTLGVVPLMKLSVKRQKEEQLRASLRQMRSAIDEFHRDTAQMVCTTAGGRGATGICRSPKQGGDLRLHDIRRRQCRSVSARSGHFGQWGKRDPRMQTYRGRGAIAATINQEESLLARDPDRSDDRRS